MHGDTIALAFDWLFRITLFGLIGFNLWHIWTKNEKDNFEKVWWTLGHVVFVFFLSIVSIVVSLVYLFRNFHKQYFAMVSVLLMLTFIPQAYMIATNIKVPEVSTEESSTAMGDIEKRALMHTIKKIIIGPEAQRTKEQVKADREENPVNFTKYYRLQKILENSSDSDTRMVAREVDTLLFGLKNGALSKEKDAEAIQLLEIINEYANYGLSKQEVEDWMLKYAEFLATS